MFNPKERRDFYMAEHKLMEENDATFTSLGSLFWFGHRSYGICRVNPVNGIP